MRLELTMDVSGHPRDVDVLVDALAPEHAEEFPGVDTQLRNVDEGQARMRLAGERATDLRAAVNAHIRWVRTIGETLDVDAPANNAEVL